jgi:hypothetical protein
MHDTVIYKITEQKVLTEVIQEAHKVSWRDNGGCLPKQ